MFKKITVLSILILFTIIGILLFYSKRDLLQKNNQPKISVGDLCKNCNIILISVDSLRADHISTFGYKRETTPNFDEFSKSGSLFLNYFTTSFLTPVTEMSVQTGKFPSATGVNNFNKTLPNDVMTIAQFLRTEKYKTSAILSSPEFNVNQTLKESFSRGFDKYTFHTDGKYYTDPIRRQFPSFQLLDPVLEAGKKNKFFLWLALGGVHWPYGAMSRNVFADKSYDGIFKGKLLDWNEFKNIYQDTDYRTMKVLQKSDKDYIINMYDNGIHEFDSYLGSLLDDLKRKGLLQNTIIIIESEHGEDLGEHGYFAHYDVLDTQVHTPLLIYSPTVRPQRIDSLASAVDILPTLIDLLGKTIPEGIQGKSLTPILKDGKSIQDAVFIERNPLWEDTMPEIKEFIKKNGLNFTPEESKDIAIRTDSWKFILRKSKKKMQQVSWFQILTGKRLNFPESELYDLKNDPEEKINVLDDNPEVASKLREELKDWYSRNASSSSQKEGIIQPYF